jgi:hypothetical protein
MMPLKLALELSAGNRRKASNVQVLIFEDGHNNQRIAMLSLNLEEARRLFACSAALAELQALRPSCRFD